MLTLIQAILYLIIALVEAVLVVVAIIVRWPNDLNGHVLMATAKCRVGPDHPGTSATRYRSHPRRANRQHCPALFVEGSDCAMYGQYRWRSVLECEYEEPSHPSGQLTCIGCGCPVQPYKRTSRPV
jgi:hypothetical protein